MKMIVFVLVLMILQTGCSSTPEISEQSQKKTLEFRNLYLKRSPDWEAAKEEWLNMGEVERKCLVNFLILHMVKTAGRTELDQNKKPIPAWRRPQLEIQSLGEIAINPLLDKLKRLKDGPAADACIEALSDIAYYKDINEAFISDSAKDNIPFQRRLVKVLFKLEEDEALSLMLEIVNGPWDWQVKATAVKLLKFYTGDRTKEVIGALTLASEDKDEFIAKNAKDALGALKGKGDL